MNLLLLKSAPTEAPFEYFVFTEFDLNTEVANAYINDTNRYEKVFEINVDNYSPELREIVDNAQNGNFTSMNLIR